MADQTSPKTDSEKMRLLLAVVQAQDVENVTSELTNLGYDFIRLPSVGGFLGRRNATLIICSPIDAEADALTTLRQNCRQRIEYISIPLESAPLPSSPPTPVNVGGATIFVLDIEYFEEI